MSLSEVFVENEIIKRLRKREPVNDLLENLGQGQLDDLSLVFAEAQLAATREKMRRQQPDEEEE